MDALRNTTGSRILDVAMEDRVAPEPKYGQQPIGSEAKRAAVQEEMKRVNKLPPTSSYASHRLRVLNKILQLLAVQNYITGRGVGIAFRWAVSVNQPSKLDSLMLLLVFMHFNRFKLKPFGPLEQFLWAHYFPNLVCNNWAHRLIAEHQAIGFRVVR